jgi:hypothetical protein
VVLGWLSPIRSFRSFKTRARVQTSPAASLSTVTTRGHRAARLAGSVCVCRVVPPPPLRRTAAVDSLATRVCVWALLPPTSLSPSLLCTTPRSPLGSVGVVSAPTPTPPLAGRWPRKRATLLLRLLARTLVTPRWPRMRLSADVFGPHLLSSIRLAARAATGKPSGGATIGKSSTPAVSSPGDLTVRTHLASN